MNTIFGPVPSRRLGRSLGIDVIPPKTCSLDCVYCESGPTTHLSVTRKAFVSPDEVLRNLDAYFREYPQSVDALTFSSAGEPTLYEPLGDLLRTIKRRYPSLPLIVLTNGTLLWDPRVRKDLEAADRVTPSLDAASDDVFSRINKPHPSLSLPLIIEGLYAFRRERRGELHLEVMVVPGYNDQPEQLKMIRQVIDRLRPDKVELNTVVRPPAYPGIRGLTAEEMRNVLKRFPNENTEVIGKFQANLSAGDKNDLGDRVMEMVKRRPCTIPEIAASLGVLPDDLKGALADLEYRKIVLRRTFGGSEFIIPA